MNHICPSCRARPFKFSHILSACTIHGATCPSCGAEVQISRWVVWLGGVVSVIPFWIFLYWKFTSHPGDVQERFALEVAMAMVLILTSVHNWVIVRGLPLREKTPSPKGAAPPAKAESVL